MKAMRGLRARRVGMAAAAVTAAIGFAATGTPAQAATTNVWRTEYYNTSASGQMYGVTAYSKSDAWAVGDTYKGENIVYSLDVLHWNGSKWNAVSVPGSSGYAANSIAGEDGVDVWVFAENAAGDWKAFRFDGSHWHTVVIPWDVGISDAVVLDSTNVWSVGGGAGCTETNGKLTSCTSLIWHWNGSTWRSYTIDANIGGLSGTSANNLRAAGVTGQTSINGNGTLVEYQWNGSGWAKKSIPSVKVQDDVSVATDSSSDVWLSSWTANASTVTALHWNGKTWSTVKSPRSLPATPSLVPDGSGGAWFGTLAHWTGKAWINTTPPPSSWSGGAIFSMAKIPGTSGSYWGAAQVSKGSSSATHPSVMIYGPLP
jgi:hypothetical protein